MNPSSLLNLASGSVNPEIRIDAFDTTPWITGRMLRGTSATPTISSNGDHGIRIQGHGYDGEAYQKMAQILFEVDGTPGLNDMPGRIMFSTTSDGSTTLVERMRITNSGNVGIGTKSPSRKLDVAGNVIANAFISTIVIPN